VGNAFLAFGRMILVLGVIIGMLLAMAHFVRKRQLGGKAVPGVKSAGRIEILSRRSTGRHASLMVVRVAGRTFLVGQSPQQMTLLSEIEGDVWSGEANPAVTSQWGAGAPFRDTNSKNTNFFRAPGKGPDSRNNPPGAWDALMDHLREKTVRR
jgi:flagellar biogenesis protein FliO